MTRQPAEQIIRKLFECIEIMKGGSFTKHDLEFISVGLKKNVGKNRGGFKKNPNKGGLKMRFKIMGKKGDAQFDYDTVEMQEIKFNELIDSGMLPTVVEAEGGRVLTKFEPKVDEVIWIPKITGG